jgi:hypothetical protein
MDDPYPDEGMVKTVRVSWDALRDAFDFVNSARPGEHSAQLVLASGKIHVESVWTDVWEEENEAATEEDAAEGEVLDIPHKTELGLGRELALWFAEEVIPDRLDDVTEFFQRRGAYTKFKALLAEENLLPRWYQFERDAEDQALRNWCEENGIEPV